MQGFIVTLLTCSIAMSALMLFYMAITPLLAKRYSAKSRYYAWLVAVVGLIIPFRPHFNNPIVKVTVPSETTLPIVQIGNGAPLTMPMPVENTMLLPTTQSISWWQIAAIVWIIGIVTFLAYHVIKHYCFIKMVRRWSNSITDGQFFSILQSLQIEMGVSKQISLHLCPCIGSPMMIGFIKPCILLPHTNLDKDELYFILKHELVHLKRKDLCYKVLVLIATAIHWFNPIVYLMAKAIDILCEISCDAETVQNTSVDMRQHYSETIIGVVKYQSKMKTALSTNFYGGKKGMKKRIFSIMDMGKKRTGLVIVCAALIFTVGTGFAFATNAATASPQTSGYLPTDIAADLDYIHLVSDSLQEAIKPYEHLGVSVDKATGLMMYEEHPVREIRDDVMGTIIAESMGPDGFAGRNVSGAIDLTVVYENNSPVGFNVSSQAEYNRRTEERRSASSNFISGVTNTAISDGNQAPVAIQWEPLPEYEKFGISYNANNKMLFNGQLVRYFWDGYEIEPGMSATRYDYLNEDGMVDVHTIRSVIDNRDGSIDPFGELTAIVAYSQQEFDARDIDFLKGNGGAPQTTAIGSTSSAGGKTFEEIFSDYKDYGIEFVASTTGGIGNVYYEGQLVKTFIDEKNNGGVFMLQSVDGGDITVRTVYDASGNLTGVKVQE